MNHSSYLQRFGLTWVKASLTMRGMCYRRLLCWQVPEAGKNRSTAARQTGDSPATNGRFGNCSS
jgi:hypothetical protein